MITMCLPGYHYNSFVATHAVGHIMYNWTIHHVDKPYQPYNLVKILQFQAISKSFSKEHNTNF